MLTQNCNIGANYYVFFVKRTYWTRKTEWKFIAQGMIAVNFLNYLIVRFLNRINVQGFVITIICNPAWPTTIHTNNQLHNHTFTYAWHGRTLSHTIFKFQPISCRQMWVCLLSSIYISCTGFGKLPSNFCSTGLSNVMWK